MTMPPGKKEGKTREFSFAGYRYVISRGGTVGVVLLGMRKEKRTIVCRPSGKKENRSEPCFYRSRERKKREATKTTKKGKLPKRNDRM